MKQADAMNAILPLFYFGCLNITAAHFRICFLHCVDFTGNAENYSTVSAGMKITPSFCRLWQCCPLTVIAFIEECGMEATRPINTAQVSFSPRRSWPLIKSRHMSVLSLCVHINDARVGMYDCERSEGDFRSLDGVCSVRQG